MGDIQRALARIDTMIEEEGLDLFRTRGRISMGAGFMLSYVDDETEDDPEALEAMLVSAERVLGRKVKV